MKDVASHLSRIEDSARSDCFEAEAGRLDERKVSKILQSKRPSRDWARATASRAKILDFQTRVKTELRVRRKSRPQPYSAPTSSPALSTKTRAILIWPKFQICASRTWSPTRAPTPSLPWTRKNRSSKASATLQASMKGSVWKELFLMRSVGQIIQSWKRLKEDFVIHLLMRVVNNFDAPNAGFRNDSSGRIFNHL